MKIEAIEAAVVGVTPEGLHRKYERIWEEHCDE